jgi:AMP deaminase
VQIPRLFDQFHRRGAVRNFAEMLSNVFEPLFEVTRDPASHPKLHHFLKRVVGFDCVDDESKIERRLHRKYPFPKDWDTPSNPPYSYYTYYIYANIAMLNQYRKARGFGKEA